MVDGVGVEEIKKNPRPMSMQSKLKLVKAVLPRLPNLAMTEITWPTVAVRLALVTSKYRRVSESTFTPTVLLVAATCPRIGSTPVKEQVTCALPGALAR